MHFVDKKLEFAVCAFAETVHIARGRAFFVGGVVRDEILGLPTKDIDIEVYGISLTQLKRAVESHFKEMKEQGKSFGVLHAVCEGTELDFSIPRRDTKTGEGHRGFEVDTDSAMGYEDALRRRDFTMNAMLKDVLTGEIIDPFYGRRDIADSILRVVDAETFADDPLRVLRGVQFAARFLLKPDNNSLIVLKETAKRLGELSKDRIREEWTKLFQKGVKPSLGLSLAFEAKAFGAAQDIVSRLVETPQEPAWHPEGDVWTHTKMACDEAAEICERENVVGRERLIVMLGVLSHDIGKPEVTKPIDGRIRSKGHSEVGVPLTREFLESFGFEHLSREIEPLVFLHAEPYKFYVARNTDAKKGDGAFRKIARTVHPATLRILSYVAEADTMGRGPFPEGAHIKQPESCAWFREEARRLGILDKEPEDVISGNELIPLGFKPGPVFGLFIRGANALQDDFGWTREKILEAFKAHPEAEKCDSVEDVVRSLGSSQV